MQDRSFLKVTSCTEFGINEFPTTVRVARVLHGDFDDVQVRFLGLGSMPSTFLLVRKPQKHLPRFPHNVAVASLMPVGTVFDPPVIVLRQLMERDSCRFRVMRRPMQT
jgi:hypothetical protein